MLYNLVRDPATIIVISLAYILSYYFVSFFFFRATRHPNKLFKRNRLLDILTSILWIAVAVLLIWSLAALAFNRVLTLNYLIVYYFVFIALFAACYGILDWHFPGMLESVQRDTWRGLLQHLIISVQTQTTIGYTKWKPGKLLVEVLACVQALLGIFFFTLAIGRAINKLP